MKVLTGIVMASLFCLLAVALPGAAQVTTATFYGSVTDSSQAVLPGASISMTHQGTGATTTKLSDERGEFAFTFLPNGAYTLKIELPGFKTYVSADFELGAAQNVRRTFALEVGGVAEQVTVTGEAPLVNTVAPEQRQSYSSLQITELPLANRNVMAVLSSGSGVTTGSAGVTTIRMNGVGGEGTRITVDGTDAAGSSEATAASTYGSFNYINMVGIDEIAEVQTTKGIVAAEYGDTMAGNVNVLTKSGTNQWHGSLFENYTGAALNARVQTATSKPPLTFNQFGGAVGGPLRKDKVFIFGAYEGYREAGQQVVQENVPTPRLRAAMIAAVPDYKLYVDNVFPIPNQPYDPAGTTGRWQGPIWYSLDENHVTLKLNAIQSGNRALAVTYSRSRPNRNSPELITRLHQSGKLQRWTVSYVMGHPTWTSESRFGYNYADVERIGDITQIRDPRNIKEEIPDGRNIAQILGLNFFSPNGDYYFMGGATWSIENKISKIVGHHVLKFGGGFTRRGSGRINTTDPKVTYANEADLLANIPNQVTLNFAYPPSKSHMDSWGLFMQDDWRVTPKLMLNLGIRYDAYAAAVLRGKDPKFPVTRYNLDGLRDSVNFIFGPLRKPPIDPDNMNLGPRFGFAYNPDGQSKNVVRGGFGVMFTHINNYVFNTFINRTPRLPYRQQFTRAESAALGFRYPLYTDDAAKPVEAWNQVDTFAALYVPNYQAPYTMNMYLGVQRALTSTMMFESAFVGVRGVKFTMTRFFNQIDRVTGLRPNQDMPFEGWYVDTSQQVFYASWQSSLRKQFSKNLSWNLHHTWGKSLSYGGGNASMDSAGDGDRNFVQDFNNVKINRAPSIGDRTHVVSGDWMYQLPALTSLNRALQKVIGGWQVAGLLRAETGESFNITQLSPGGPPSRPDIINIKHTVLPDYRKTGQYLNIAAFAKVPLGAVSRVPIRPGNAAYRPVRGPGDWGIDFSLGKNFNVRENVRLLVRVDMFNALNHTNLGNPIATIDDANFGKITTTGGARKIQAQGRISF